MIEEKFLAEYAYLGRRAYMDCSTLGLQPERTLKAAREFLDDFAYHAGKPLNGDSYERKNLCRERLGRMIHADPEDIFFTENTTQGNNLISSFYPLNAGDEVILGNGDFVTVWLPWAEAQKKGVRLVWVQNENGVADAEDYIQKITDRTKVIAISWVQSSSGYVTDLARLGEVCRTRGIILSVDGIQGMGRLPVDVQKMKIDVLASSSFKGMLGVMGAGFCYCRREIMDKIIPPICGGNIDVDSFHFTPGFTEAGIPEFASGAARMESGTGNNYGITAMSESVGLLLEIGIDKIAAHIRELEDYYRECLKHSGLNVQMLGTEDPATWGGSISFLCPEEYHDELERELKKAEITVAVRHYVRVSLHYYNEKEHIDRLMNVMERVLQKGK